MPRRCSKGSVTRSKTPRRPLSLSAGGAHWDKGLIERLGLPAQLLGEIVPAGSNLGPMKPRLAEELGLEGAEIVTPATHDTASSVAAIPLEGDGEVFLSSGSWSLMGIESRVPFASDAARRLNVTNEGGVERRYRVLKNITGLCFS